MTDEPAAPVASIIIVSHNSRDDLSSCLQSLGVCTSVEHEIIVVDNASTDGSVEYLAQAFPQVRLICSEHNQGFGGGGNLGSKAARGEFLVFLNPDTIVMPGWLAPLLDPLATDPTIGMTTAKIVLADDPEHINACGNDMHISGLTLCRGMGQPAAGFNDMVEVSAVSGAAFAMRKTVFEQLCRFDEQFFMYMEDADLSLRARLAGYRILFAPLSMIRHRYRLRFGTNKVFYQERNRYLMLLKVYHWPTLLALIPTLILAEAVSWGFVLSREQGQVGGKLRAYAWPLRHWRSVAESRRATQRMRRVNDHSLLASAGYRLDFTQTGDTAAAHLAESAFSLIFRLLRTLTLVLV